MAVTDAEAHGVRQGVSALPHDAAMIGLEALATPVLQAIATQGSSAGARALSRGAAVSAKRGARRAVYHALQTAVLRAEYRIALLMAVNSARGNPLNVPAVLGGLPTLTEQMDRTLLDLSSVIDKWRHTRDVAPPGVVGAADDLVLALAELLKSPDPGILRPIRRRAAAARSKAAKVRYQEAARSFDLAAEADAGRRWRLRHQARRELDVSRQRALKVRA